MLPSATNFPEQGSRAFLAPRGHPVTILRRNADGSAFVRHDSDKSRRASGNCTYPLTDLFPTERDAVFSKRRRSQGAAK